MDPALNFGPPAGIVQAIKGSEMAVRGVRQSGGVALDVWHACRCVSILNCVNCDLAVNLNVQCCEMGNMLCFALYCCCILLLKIPKQCTQAFCFGAPCPGRWPLAECREGLVAIGVGAAPLALGALLGQRLRRPHVGLREGLEVAWVADLVHDARVDRNLQLHVDGGPVLGLLVDGDQLRHNRAASQAVTTSNLSEKGSVHHKQRWVACELTYSLIPPVLALATCKPQAI